MKTTKRELINKIQSWSVKSKLWYFGLDSLTIKELKRIVEYTEAYHTYKQHATIAGFLKLAMYDEQTDKFITEA